MIVCRSPYRISLGGGGTDLPSYYQQQEGFFISAAINRYVYITINKILGSDIIIRAPQLHIYNEISEIKHNLIRCAADTLDLKLSGLELSSMAELPVNSGMGSSGSFLVCLLKALSEQQGKNATPNDLAELAFNIEHEQLKLPVGKQDQYISALGGLRLFTIDANGIVQSRLLNLTNDESKYFMRHLVLFYTGKQRASSIILQEQQQKTNNNDSKMLNNLNHIKILGQQACAALESANFEQFGWLMDEHWQYKLQRSSNMSDDSMIQLYHYAKQNGAIGGKLIGAGGGGFFMFYSNDMARLIDAMGLYGYAPLKVMIDEVGVCRLT